MVEISRTIAQRNAWYKGRYKKMESKSLKKGKYNGIEETSIAESFQ